MQKCRNASSCAMYRDRKKSELMLVWPGSRAARAQLCMSRQSGVRCGGKDGLAGWGGRSRRRTPRKAIQAAWQSRRAKAFIRNYVMPTYFGPNRLQLRSGIGTVAKREGPLTGSQQVLSTALRRRFSYGLKKRSNSSSSCLLSEARTRMWRTMVPEMREEKPSGELWQREQFCWKMRVPLGFLLFCGWRSCMILALLRGWRLALRRGLRERGDWSQESEGNDKML